MRVFITLYFILLLLLTGSCQESSYTSQLHRAEELMEERPDSAWLILKQIPSNALQSAKSKAMYALLYTQAQHKNYIVETNDSLINQAVDYYEHCDNPHGKFLSLFYKGIVQFNAQNFISAKRSLVEAEEISNTITDDYYIGLLYSQIGYIYQKHYDYPNALKMFELAFKHFQHADKQYHQIFCLLNQGDSYHNMHQYEKSDSIYHLALVEAQKINYDVVVRQCLNNLIILNVEHNKIVTADSLFQIWNKHYNLKQAASTFLARVSRIYSENNKIDKAEDLLKLAWKNAETDYDSISLYHAEAKHYSILKEYPKSLQALSQGTKLQNEKLLQVIQAPLLKANNDFLSDIRNIQTYKQKWMQTRFMCYTLLLLICFTIVIYLGRKKMQKKNVQIEQYLDIISEMKNSFEKRHSQQNQMLQQLFQDRFMYINSLSETFSLYRKEENHQRLGKSIYKQVKTFIEELSHDKETFKKIEDIINSCYDNLLIDTKNEFNFLDKTYRQICFHIVGFSANAISLLMNENVNTIYKRRKRVKNTVSESDSKRKEQLLELLS